MEAVIFCGIPASGKTTFYRERFLDTHVRISRDLLRTRHREAAFLRTCLETRQRFVVDKLNATAADRAPYVGAARDAGFRVVAYWFDTPPRVAMARNERRPPASRVPVVAILGTYKHLQVPRSEEGFEHVERVRFAADAATGDDPVAAA